MVIRSPRKLLRLLCRSVFITFLLTSLRAAAETPTSVQALIDAAAPGATVRLPAGEFDGLIVVRKSLRIHGERGKTVLRSKAGTTLVISAPDVELTQLIVRGDVAVEVSNGATLKADYVGLHGRKGVLAIKDGARVSLNHVALDAAPVANEPCVAAVSVQHASVTASHVRLTGTCRRSLDAASSVVKIEHVSATGATVTALQFVDSEVDLESVDATSESTEMAAVFAARSTVKARGLKLKGGLQGWLQRSGKTELSRLRFEGCAAAGIALIGGSAHVDHAELTGPFTQAGFFISDRAQIDVSDSIVVNAGATGLLVNRSEANVTRARFSGLRFDKDGDFGHAVVAERSRVSVSKVAVDDAAGAAVYASQSASSVDVSELSINDVGAGLVTLDGARMTVHRITGSSKGVVIFASQRSTIDLSGASVRAAMGVVECGGATVRKGADVAIVAASSDVKCSADEVDATWQRVVLRR